MMKHLDEHTLDLLALKGGRAANSDREIEEHLAGCSRCSQMLEKMMAYYADAEAEARKPIANKGSDSRSVSRRGRTKPAAYFADPRRSTVRYIEVSLPSAWRRAGQYARVHPVISSFFALVLIGVGLMLFSYLSSDGPNISYYYYNRTGHRLEAYSSSNKLLWSLPSFSLPQMTTDSTQKHSKMTTVADLNSDGRNELITLVPVGNEAPQTSIRVIDSRGTIVRRVTFGKMNVTYKGIYYDTPFGPASLFKETMPDGKVEMFVVANNRRSPNVLVRFNSEFKILGEYWHYGHIASYPVKSYEGGSKEVILVGCHDVDDMQGKDYDFMAVLDPFKVIGDGESSATPGFGLKASPAEKYYVRFPLTDMGKATGQRLHPFLLNWPSDSVLYVALQTDLPIESPAFFGFTYVFDRVNMKVREVKFIMRTPQTYDRLKREGKVHGTFDEQYLDDLKNGVRYWNGKEWIKKATRVKHY